MYEYESVFIHIGHVCVVYICVFVLFSHSFLSRSSFRFRSLFLSLLASYNNKVSYRQQYIYMLLCQIYSCVHLHNLLALPLQQALFNLNSRLHAKNTHIRIDKINFHGICINFYQAFAHIIPTLNISVVSRKEHLVIKKKTFFFHNFEQEVILLLKMCFANWI